MHAKIFRLAVKKLNVDPLTTNVSYQHIHSSRLGWQSTPFLDADCLPLSRQPGQGGTADTRPRDLRAQLLEAEAAHFANKTGGSTAQGSTPADSTTSAKRQLEAGAGQDDDIEEDIETKRRRVLAETRDIDADSDGSDSDSSEENRFVKDWPRGMNRG